MTEHNSYPDNTHSIDSTSYTTHTARTTRTARTDSTGNNLRTDCTNEELVERISAGDETAYGQLFLNLRPIILYHAQKYKGLMDTFTTEDFLQEGHIVAWQIISRGNYDSSKGAFSTYFSRSVQKKFYNICRDYTLKNFVCIEETEDCRGNVTRILIESNFAKEYRVKKAEQQRRWYEKKKAQEPPKEKKPPMTKQERNRKVMEYQKVYYAEHPEKLAERREKNRIAQRARYAAKKAEMMAVLA